MTAPVIGVDYNWDSETYTLVASSHGTTEPAGPRLFRGGDFPDIQFSHTDQTSAKRDRDLLQSYCTLAWAGKAPRSKGKEEKEEVKMSVFDIKNAVWSL